MSRSCVAALVAAVVVVAGAPRRGHAQNAAQAETLFNQAIALKKQGKLAEACELFFASQRLDPSPATQMNVGDCREKNGQLASAWEAFVDVDRQARGNGKYGRMADLARERAAALEPRLSTLTVLVPDEVRIEGLVVMRDGAVLEAGAWNTALPIDGGTHTISGRAPGHETWSTTVTVKAETDRQQVQVPRFKALREPGGGRGKTIVIARTSPSLWTARRKVAVGVAGAGVAALIAGAYFGLHAQSLQGDADARCPQNDGAMCSPDEARQATSLSARAEDSALGSSVALGVGAGAIAGAAVLWLTGGPRAAERPARVSITPRVAPAFTGVAASVRF